MLLKTVRKDKGEAIIANTYNVSTLYVDMHSSYLSKTLYYISGDFKGETMQAASIHEDQNLHGEKEGDAASSRSSTRYSTTRIAEKEEVRLLSVAL